MESEGSLQYSQKSATAPYPEPDTSHIHLLPYFPNLHSNIILLPTPRTPEWSLPFSFFDQNFVCMSHSTDACYIPRQSLPPLIDM